MSVADRLYRRVQMMLAPVKITATDDTGPVHRAQVRAMAPEQIDNVAVLQLYGVASHAMPGSDAMALFVSGDRSNAVIVATNNQGARMRNLKPGEVALYTDEGDYVKLSRGKIIEVNCQTKVRLVTPRLEVTGDIIDHCDDQPHTVQNMRDIYNEHEHGDVEPGGGTTSPPTVPQ